MSKLRWLALVTCLVVFCVGVAGSEQAVGTDPQARASASAPAPLNLNAGTAADLEGLPGIGPALAARIVEFRQKNGGFKKIEDLMSVKGIGEKQFLKLKPLVTAGPAKPADRTGGGTRSQED